jgi:hypothetical protein
MARTTPTQPVMIADPSRPKRCRAVGEQIAVKFKTPSSTKSYIAPLIYHAGSIGKIILQVQFGARDRGRH